MFELEKGVEASSFIYYFPVLFSFIEALICDTRMRIFVNHFMFSNLS